jgi:hypothetical protein
MRRAALIAVVVGGLVLAAALALATSTTVTRQAVNYEVAAKLLPLYVKAIDFIHRHEHYRLLAREITAGLRTDRERVEAILAWTRREVRPIPEGFPIVDDHVLDIIVRRYGSRDQMADVFTVLSTYAGVPAHWQSVRVGPMPGLYTYVQLDGRWLLVDLRDGGLTPPPPALAAPPARPLRAELQMPWPRLAYEVRRLVHDPEAR